MDEVLNQKINSLFEIFVGFLIVDWDVEEVEYENMFLEFFDYLEAYTIWAKPDFSFEDVIMKIAEDTDNFSKNANFLNSVTNPEEKIAILVAISKVVFADADFSETEYVLFEKLMEFWNISKKDLNI